MGKNSVKFGFRGLASMTAALCIFGAASSPVSAEAGPAQGKPQNSAAVAKPLKAAQDAMNAKHYQDALAKLREAQNIPGKNAYDQYVIDEMVAFSSARTGDYAETARAYETTLNSPYLDQSEVPKRVELLAKVNYQLKNYDKAIEYGNRAVRGGYADDQINTFIGQAYYLKGDYRNAQRFIENNLDAQSKRGQVPKEQQLQLILGSCKNLKDSPCMTRMLERLVSYYPKSEYWQNLLYSLFQAPDKTERSKLHVYRLAAEVDVLVNADDYTEMAQLAIEQGSPGEAERILEKGFQKKVFTDTRTQDKNKRLLESAKRKAINDQATLAEVDKDAAASQTGDKDVGVGLAYLSYQQYDKAVAALTRGLAKPGVRSEPEARLLLGIAQLEAGQKDEAVKSFRAVKGDKNFERLANLWSLHARQA